MRSEPSEHHITVARTARYFTIGDPAATEIWFVCHGYGQLAARFLKRFEPITEGARLVVAPEGLSRFYVGSGERRDQPVGATWMTREDRLHEIADYVKYLDAVYADVLWGGELPPELDLAPAAARLARLRITLVAGTEDEYITPKVLAGIERRLNERDIPFQTHVFEGGHEIDETVLRQVASS